MKYSASLLLLGSVLCFAAPADVGVTTDAQLVASYEFQGVCAYYFEKPGITNDLSQTCIKYCENNGGHGYSECDHSSYNNIDLPDGVDQSTIFEDEAGDVFLPALCRCENEDVEGIANAILDVVIEGLSKLDEVICGVFMTAMVTIVEVGIDLIPGGAEATAAARAVEGVKSFTENALDVADSMGNWVGQACGIDDPNWPNSLFDILLTSPDSYGTSIGCKRTKKSECKSVASVPDKAKSKGSDDAATKEPDPATSDVPAPTTASVDPTSTPTAASVNPTSIPTTASVNPISTPTTASVNPISTPTTASVYPTLTSTTASIYPTSNSTTASVDPTSNSTTASVDPISNSTTASVDPISNSTTASVNSTSNSPTGSVNSTSNSTTASVTSTTNSTTASVDPTTSAATSSFHHQKLLRHRHPNYRIL